MLAEAAVRDRARHSDRAARELHVAVAAQIARDRDLAARDLQTATARRTRGATGSSDPATVPVRQRRGRRRDRRVGGRAWSMSSVVVVVVVESWSWWSSATWCRCRVWSSSSSSVVVVGATCVVGRLDRRRCSVVVALGRGRCLRRSSVLPSSSVPRSVVVCRLRSVVVDCLGGRRRVRRSRRHSAAPGVPNSPSDPYVVTEVHQFAATALSSAGERRAAEAPIRYGSWLSGVHVDAVDRHQRGVVEVDLVSGSPPAGTPSRRHSRRVRHR